jgi:hypothetical protein
MKKSQTKSEMKWYSGESDHFFILSGSFFWKIKDDWDREKFAKFSRVLTDPSKTIYSPYTRLIFFNISDLDNVSRYRLTNLSVAIPSLKNVNMTKKDCPTAYFKSLRKIFHRKPVLITCYGHVWEFFIIYLEREIHRDHMCIRDFFPFLPLKNIAIPFFSRSTPSLEFLFWRFVVDFTSYNFYVALGGAKNRFSRRPLLTLNGVSHLAEPNDDDDPICKRECLGASSLIDD